MTAPSAFVPGSGAVQRESSGGDGGVVPCDHVHGGADEIALGRKRASATGSYAQAMGMSQMASSSVCAITRAPLVAFARLLMSRIG